MAPRPSYAHGQNFDFWDYNVAALLGAGGAGGQWFSLRKRVAEHFKTPSVANTHPHARALAPCPQEGRGCLLAQGEGRQGQARCKQGSACKPNWISRSIFWRVRSKLTLQIRVWSFS